MFFFSFKTSNDAYKNSSNNNNGDNSLVDFNLKLIEPVWVGCRIQEAWGWCTGMTQRDGMGRDVGGGFRMGNKCTPVVDACWCMAKPIQYCKVNNNNNKINKRKKKKKKIQMIEVCKDVLDIEGQIMSCESYHIKFVCGFSW